jgi:hypothetical protein
VRSSDSPLGNSVFDPDPSTREAFGGQSLSRKLWTFRDLVFYLGSAALALVVANVLAISAYAALALRMGWPPASGRLGENAFFLIALQIVFHALVFGYTILLVRVNYRRPFWEELRWSRSAARPAAKFLLGGVFLAFLIRFAPPLLPGQEDFPLQKLFHSPAAAYLIGAFAILIAPFMEELIFRGALFRFSENLVGPRFAIGATALFFSALHVPEYWGAWNHVLLIFVVGLVLSLVRGRTGSVMPAYLLHLTYNASLMAILFVETDRFRSLAGPIAN